MKTTKDILKETLGSLNFPDAAWDELAEKIDNNKKTTLEKIQEIAEDEPSPWLNEAREREMHLNMQYYYEYVLANGYVTPKDWIEKYKHF